MLDLFKLFISALLLLSCLLSIICGAAGFYLGILSLPIVYIVCGMLMALIFVQLGFKPMVYVKLVFLWYPAILSEKVSEYVTR